MVIGAIDGFAKPEPAVRQQPRLFPSKENCPPPVPRYIGEYFRENAKIPRVFPRLNPVIEAS
jgi:hypothetical protein